MDPIPLLVERLTLARKWTNDLLADVEESRWFQPPAPGLGHVAWQVGHLAASQVILLQMRCFGKQFADCAPAEYQKTFARGSTPVADPRAYPTIPVIREFFERTQNQSIEMIRVMPPSELDKPAGADPHPMFANKGGAIGMAVMHETFHAGQIALIRRLFGKSFLR